jgi:hypothetical protein
MFVVIFQARTRLLGRNCEDRIAVPPSSNSNFNYSAETIDFGIPEHDPSSLAR